LSPEVLLHPTIEDYGDLTIGLGEIIKLRNATSKSPLDFLDRGVKLNRNVNSTPFPT
jgi:hypothetical protein